MFTTTHLLIDSHTSQHEKGKIVQMEALRPNIKAFAQPFADLLCMDPQLGPGAEPLTFVQ